MGGKSVSFTVSERLYASLGGMVAACLFILLFGHLAKGSAFGDALFDLRGSFPYPFTIQNIMWIIFFVGGGELVVRYLRGGEEAGQLGRRLLPQDSSTMLRHKDLGGVYKTVKNSSRKNYFLQRLILRAIAQFQSSRSIDQANSLMNSSLDLFQHEIDLRYGMLRYIVWFIPTLGFIGTVVGIALALNGAAGAQDLSSPDTIREVISKLGVAFYTTLLALMQSSILVFVMHIAQSREEGALNDAGQYCLDNLINRLYER